MSATVSEKQKPRTSLVVGGTGAIGGELLQALVDCAAYERVIVLGRRLPVLQCEQVVGMQVGFEHLEDYTPDVAIDDVFCALGTTLHTAGSAEAFRRVDLDYVLKVGELARRVDARSLSVVSSIGADAKASSLYARTKGEMEEALRAIDLPALHLFRPSLLSGSLSRADFRWKEALANGGLALIGPLLLHGRYRKYRRISPRSVARAMVYLACTDDLGTVIYESDAISAVAECAASR